MFLQEYPNKAVDVLNKFGIEAFRGATQLTVLEPNIPKFCAICSQQQSNPQIDVESPEEGQNQNLKSTSFAQIASRKLLKSHVNMVMSTDLKNAHLCQVQLKHKCQYIYPHQARYLMDHVIYLPINRNVPFRYID